MLTPKRITLGPLNASRASDGTTAWAFRIKRDLLEQMATSVDRISLRVIGSRGFLLLDGVPYEVAISVANAATSPSKQCNTGPEQHLFHLRERTQLVHSGTVVGCISAEAREFKGPLGPLKSPSKTNPAPTTTNPIPVERHNDRPVERFDLDRDNPTSPTIPPSLCVEDEELLEPDSESKTSLSPTLTIEPIVAQPNEPNNDVFRTPCLPSAIGHMVDERKSSTAGSVFSDPRDLLTSRNRLIDILRRGPRKRNDLMHLMKLTSAQLLQVTHLVSDYSAETQCFHLKSQYSENSSPSSILSYSSSCSSTASSSSCCSASSSPGTGSLSSVCSSLDSLRGPSGPTTTTSSSRSVFRKRKTFVPKIEGCPDHDRSYPISKRARLNPNLIPADSPSDSAAANAPSSCSSRGSISSESPSLTSSASPTFFTPSGSLPSLLEGLELPPKLVDLALEPALPSATRVQELMRIYARHQHQLQLIRKRLEQNTNGFVALVQRYENAKRAADVPIETPDRQLRIRHREELKAQLKQWHASRKSEKMALEQASRAYQAELLAIHGLAWRFARKVQSHPTSHKHLQKSNLQEVNAKEVHQPNSSATPTVARVLAF